MIDIEKHIESRASKRLKLIPKDIRKQLERIEKVVMFQFKLGTHWRGNVQLFCFDAVMDSRMTLNELESIFKSEGKKLSEKYDFEEALKHVTKKVDKAKKLSALRNSMNLEKMLKEKLSGNRPTK